MKKIKHKVRDVVIWSLCVFGFTKRYQINIRKNGPLVRALCFHDVPNAEWFNQILRLLQANYNVITPEQFHSQTLDEDRINILLTFDDGYQSWVDVVLPALEKTKLKGLFFISSGLLDAAEQGGELAVRFIKDRLRLQTTRSLLTWTGAKQLVGAGHTIGGHTVTHAALSQLDREQVQREVQDDKQRLESELSITLQDFAYPFGTPAYFNRLVSDVLRESGYMYRYSAITGFADDNKSDISRTLVEEEMNLQKFKIWVEGGYDIFVYLVKQLWKN